jgi:hypothetical protein
MQEGYRKKYGFLQKKPRKLFRPASHEKISLANRKKG